MPIVLLGRAARMEANELSQGRSTVPAAWVVLTILGLTFALRAFDPGQPILENAVGRQVPTAMAARNLERGSGFFRPQLDTGPFPNLFLVEPPVYATACALLHQVLPVPLEACGRWVSALAWTLGAWGLFGLVRRREGAAVALWSVLAFSLFPVALRYGRAFQPDAWMIGLTLAGVRLREDAWETESRWGKRLGWLVLTLGLTAKCLGAVLLLPFLARPIGTKERLKVLACLAPALLWYVYAGFVLAEGNGSRAASDSARNWAGVLFVPSELLDPRTYRWAGYFLAIRTLTPLGFPLALGGWLGGGRVDRTWVVWGLGTAVWFLALAGKWDHEYYWLMATPLAAVGLARALRRILAVRRGWVAGLGLTCGFVLLALVQARSTWVTPPDWASAPAAARDIKTLVREDAWLVAPEALMYLADRRGCRLEWEPAARRRAAGEWNGSVALREDDPLALVEFYRDRGARYFADVEPPAGSGSRDELHRAVRARYRVLVDCPGRYLIAELVPKDDDRRP